MRAGMIARWAGAAVMLLAAGCGHLESRRMVAPSTSQPAVVATTQAMRAGFVDVRAVVIVRHGDIEVAKKALMGDATPLTKRGEERARELAYALKDAGVTRIVTSEALRTKELGIAEVNPSPPAHSHTPPAPPRPIKFPQFDAGSGDGLRGGFGLGLGRKASETHRGMLRHGWENLEEVILPATGGRQRG